MANIRRSRKSGFTLRGGVMRRETVWFSSVFFAQTLAVATPVLLTSLGAAALAVRPFTVIRTRGELLIRSDQTANTEDQGAAYGRAVVSDQAVAIGVTAIPTPVTDSGSDLWYVYQVLLNSTILSSAVGFDGSPGKQYTVDSRAMRKVEDGQDIVSVLEGSGIGAGSVVLGFTKSLIKMH